MKKSTQSASRTCMYANSSPGKGCLRWMMALYIYSFSVLHWQWHPLICLTPLWFFPKNCLSFFLFPDLWSMWHGMAKTYPSLRKAIRCTPGWWWLCWTRTENGKRWVSCCVLNAGEGRKPGQQRTRITSFPRSFPIEFLQIPFHAQGQSLLGTRQTNIVRCDWDAFPRYTVVIMCCSLCWVLKSQEKGSLKDLG